MVNFEVIMRWIVRLILALAVLATAIAKLL